MFNLNLMIFKTTKVILPILFQDLNFSVMYEHNFSPLIYPIYLLYTINRLNLYFTLADYYYSLRIFLY